jgi:hypothetical protein
MATYDSNRERVVLFGGSDDNGDCDGSGKDACGVTWEWNGDDWTSYAEDPNGVTAPVARGAMGLAYDPNRQVTVLFGGYDANYDNLGDTWEWDGVSWSLRAPADPNGVLAPPPASYVAMAYEPTARRIVLFGGSSDSGDIGDLWTWDGAGWTLVPPSGAGGCGVPPARNGAVMSTTDRGRGVLLFGGAAGFSSYLGDTWLLQDDCWQDLTPVDPNDTPSARWWPAVAYDATTGRVLLQGGTVQFGDDCGTGSSICSDAWWWDGANWARDTTVGTLPPGLTEHTLAYHQGRSRGLLLGGFLPSFEQNANQWVFQSAGALRPTHQVGFVTAVAQPGDLSVCQANPSSCPIRYARMSWTSGGDSQPDGVESPGALLFAWEGGAWTVLGSNSAPSSDPAEITFESFDRARIAGLLFGDGATINISVAPKGIAGWRESDAFLASRYIELELRYRR